jgi:hypothetical protein
MLDRLPSEILDEILLLASTPQPGPYEEDKRRHTLKSCCLINKRLREHAQPLLWSVIVLRPGLKQPDALEVVSKTERGKALVDCVRLVRAFQLPSSTVSPAIKQFAASIRKLDLSYLGGGFDLFTLSSLPSEPLPPVPHPSTHPSCPQTSRRSLSSSSSLYRPPSLSTFLPSSASPSPVSASHRNNSAASSLPRPSPPFKLWRSVTATKGRNLVRGISTLGFMLRWSRPASSTASTRHSSTASASFPPSTFRAPPLPP